MARMRSSFRRCQPGAESPSNLGGRRPTMFRGREIRLRRRLRPTMEAGGTSRRSPAETSGSPDRVNNGGGMNGGRGSAPEYPAQRDVASPDGTRSRRTQHGPGLARGYSRPPLEMRQPIVTPRSSEVRGSAPRNRLHHEWWRRRWRWKPGRMAEAVAAATGRRSARRLRPPLERIIEFG